MRATNPTYTLFVYAATWGSQTTTPDRAVALNITTVTILTFLVVLHAHCVALSLRRARMMVAATLSQGAPPIWPNN